MGIFDALTTAVTGLQAQSVALQNVSGNIANSKTTGYKETDTSFEDLVTAAAQSQQNGQQQHGGGRRYGEDGGQPPPEGDEAEVRAPGTGDQPEAREIPIAAAPPDAPA